MKIFYELFTSEFWNILLWPFQLSRLYFAFAVWSKLEKSREAFEICRKQVKGPSINNVGNFSKFLTPPSPISAVFSYYPAAILTNFWPLPIANVVYEQPPPSRGLKNIFGGNFRSNGSLSKELTCSKGQCLGFLEGFHLFMLELLWLDRLWAVWLRLLQLLLWSLLRFNLQSWVRNFRIPSWPGHYIFFIKK